MKAAGEGKRQKGLLEGGESSAAGLLILTSVPCAVLVASFKGGTVCPDWSQTGRCCVGVTALSGDSTPYGFVG